LNNEETWIILLAAASGEYFHPVGYDADWCIETNMSEELLSPLFGIV
jgi:hypothetical protein